VHRADHQIELVGGERLAYDALLLATGSSPRRVQVPGADLRGVHYLRRIGESEGLRDTLANGGPVAIVGAGWIGLEVAAAARHHGCDVTVVEPQSVPLAGPLGEEVGGHFARLHRAHGVDLRLGTGATGFEGQDTVTGVRTSSGDLVAAETVVVAVGIVPNTRLAASADLEVLDGIATDEMLQTSDPAIWAAGDVASAFHPVLGERVRVEHWANALNQGAAAGKAMAGKGEPYVRLPYFFTDQYDLGMEYHGHVGKDGHEQVVLRGEPESGHWFAFWLRDGVLLAAMHVNMWDDGDAVKALARARPKVDPAALADPDTPLSDLL
jgi:3-phenylpropionate/trans-cinnamate dioxygenase ferredoxin reductase subunit